MKKIASVFIFLCMTSIAALTANAQVSIGVGINVRTAPPELPEYTQPPCPVDGYLWQPGYWAYDDADGYYWVPGVWVAPPDPGLYWTPAYWGYNGGFYGFHAGYWGPHVGFYGGINYGYGYGGVGFVGGAWSGGHFRYNTAVVRVNTRVIHNTYIDRNVVHNVHGGRTSFNGPGGVNARPRPQEMAAARDRHIQPTSQQMSHQQVASHDRGQFAAANHGRPAATAVGRVSSRPFSEQTHTATRSGGFGNNAGAAARTPEAHNNAARPAASARSFSARPAAQQREQQARPQQQHEQQQQAHPQQQRQQPQQQRAQPQQQQARPAGGFGGGGHAGGFGGGGHAGGGGGHAGGGGGGRHH